MSAPALIAIDPGPIESAWCVVDTETLRPLGFDKEPNETVRSIIMYWDAVVIEMIASYGMAVGREVFETCVWIGRFIEVAAGLDTRLVYRRDVKLHLCHSAKASDANVRQALVDRFAPYESNHGKGTKKHPGWFHGFRADVWQAYALAVAAIDGGMT